MGLVYTSSVDPIAFYDRPRRTRWWGLVLFSLGTALPFPLEPLVSHPHPYPHSHPPPPLRTWWCFPSKTGSLREKKRNDPPGPRAVLCSLIYLRHVLFKQILPQFLRGPALPLLPSATARVHLTPAQESCSFSPFHSRRDLLFSTSKRRLVCTSCFKQ